MSIEVFLRKPDGTAWAGRIMYDFSAKRENDFMLKFGRSDLESLDNLYHIYGVSSALEFTPSHLLDIGNLALVYKFLYGYTLSELMERKNNSTTSYESWLYEPIKWSKPMVLSMNWDSFCVSYYTLLSTSNSFNSKAWSALFDILRVLKQDDRVLSAILLQCDRTYDKNACEEFWNSIYNGLIVKTLEWLNVQTCYTAYEALQQIRDIIPDDRYAKLEIECCDFWSAVACDRINDEVSKTHTIKELISFDGELAFFYKELFLLESTAVSTKHYVINTIFAFLLNKGDKVFSSGDALGADAIYQTALNFAKTTSDCHLVESKRNNISAYVEKAKAEKTKLQDKADKKYKKECRQDQFVKCAAKFILIAVVVCVFLFIVFGAFAIFGVIETFSKAVLKITIVVIIAFVLFMFVMNALDKRR